MEKMLKNKIVIIGNGTINDIIFHKKLLENVDLIICADGGANNAKQMDIIIKIKQRNTVMILTITGQSLGSM